MPVTTRARSRPLGVGRLAWCGRKLYVGHFQTERVQTADGGFADFKTIATLACLVATAVLVIAFCWPKPPVRCSLDSEFIVATLPEAMGALTAELTKRWANDTGVGSNKCNTFMLACASAHACATTERALDSAVRTCSLSIDASKAYATGSITTMLADYLHERPQGVVIVHNSEKITRQLANELKPLLSVNGAIFSSGKQILATRATGILVTHFAAIEELVKEGDPKVMLERSKAFIRSSVIDNSPEVDAETADQTGWAFRKCVDFVVPVTEQSAAKLVSYLERTK